MEIIDLKRVALDTWLGTVLERHPFPPFWWIPGMSTESQHALLAQTLQAASTGERRDLIGLSVSGRLLGVAELRHLDWDSQHFGFPVYRLDHFAVWSDRSSLAAHSAALAEAVVARARALGARAVHSWLPMDNIRAIQALEGAGFRTMDILVTWLFEHARQKISDYPDRCIIRGAQPGDEAVFVPLAREAYTDIPDRFHSDPHLPTERSDALYAEWIKNSFSGQLADHIVVAEVEGRPAGYTTLKLEGDHGGLSNVRTGGLILSAVAPWAEGKGLYTSMINGGLKWLAAQGVQVSHLGTQVNNYPVQRAWARLGFRLAKSGPSMHLWLGD